MPLTATEHRLLLIRHALGYDGGVTRFLSLAETLRRRGGEATILAGRGPLEGRAADSGTLRRVDWTGPTRRELGDLLRREARGHTAALIGCLPQTLPLVPDLAREIPVHLCVHSTPEALEESFRRRRPLSELSRALDSLHASGRVILSAASEAEAREHEERLGLPPASLSAFPNGVAARDGARPSAGPIHTVALVSRLSVHKLPHVVAAAELVAAGLDAGREVRLEVHGSGNAEREAIEAIESRLPEGAWRLREATDRPSDAMRGADVVVGGGRTSLEALALGRRVAPAKAAADPRGQLAAPVTPATLDRHVYDNFRWSGRAPVAAADAWATLERQTESSLGLVQERVRHELSDDAMLDRELHLLEELRRRPEHVEALRTAAAAYDPGPEGPAATAT
jgi:hypothetical protein